MISSTIGIALGLAIGARCRWFDLPLPAPLKIVGALLVACMTLEFFFTGLVLGRLQNRKTPPN